MSVMKRIPILLVVFVALAILPKLTWSDAAVDPILAAGLQKFKESVSAPSFAIEDMEGNRLKLEDFRGKIVLIDFWATW
jgi:cytochrome oxidase Cu insertion factor (SCO1/SenC/PrrC family)